MGARDQGLITLERRRNLSLKDIGERVFCFGLGDLEWEGEVQNIC